MKDYASAFYHSSAWLSCRSAFIAERRAIDGGMCQRCHNRLGYIVHHKIELTPKNITDPNISLNHSNFEYLCHECHNREHDVFQSSRNFIFDEDGNIFEKPRELL